MTALSGCGQSASVALPAGRLVQNLVDRRVVQARVVGVTRRQDRCTVGDRVPETDPVGKSAPHAGDGNADALVLDVLRRADEACCSSSTRRCGEQRSPVMPTRASAVCSAENTLGPVSLGVVYASLVVNPLGCRTSRAPPWPWRRHRCCPRRSGTGSPCRCSPRWPAGSSIRQQFPLSCHRRPARVLPCWSRRRSPGGSRCSGSPTG